MARRAVLGKKPVAQMSHAERGRVIMQLLRRVAELQNERLEDGSYRALRRERAAANQELFKVQNTVAQLMSMIATLQREVAVHSHDTDCARAELEAARTALEETPLSVFQASADVLRALREAAQEEVGAEVAALQELVAELDQACLDMTAEISGLRDALEEERDWAAQAPVIQQRLIASLEARFSAPARLARMNGTPPPPVDVPQAIYFAQDPKDERGYFPSLAASQHTTV